MIKSTTKEQCVAEYNRLAAKVPNKPISINFWDKCAKISRRQVRRLFGTWGQFKTLMDGVPPSGAKESQSAGLEFKDKYVYNEADRTYLFLLDDKLGKNLLIPEDKIKNIIQCYSDYNGKPDSINEISIKFNIPRQYLTHIFSILGVTHDSLPVTKEDLENKPEEKLLEEIVQQKKFNLYQKLQKNEWVSTKESAAKWDALQQGQLEPLKEYIEGIKNIEPLPEIKVRKGEGDTLMLVGLNDIHISSKADPKFLTFGSEWNTEIALKALENYTKKLIKLGKKEGVKSLVVGSLGDNWHSFTGSTVKGTPLKTDLINEDQFDAVIKGYRIILDGLLANFEKVDLIGAQGNHDGYFQLHVVFKLLEQIYKDNKRISIKATTKDYDHFQLGSNLIVFGHGASAQYKFQFPKDNKGRKELGLRLIRNAEKEGQYKNIKNVFFLVGDLHHFECLDFGAFIFVLLPSLVNGDEFASSLCLDGQPGQNVLILENNSMDYKVVHLATEVQ